MVTFVTEKLDVIPYVQMYKLRRLLELYAMENVQNLSGLFSAIYVSCSQKQHQLQLRQLSRYRDLNAKFRIPAEGPWVPPSRSFPGT